jgi:hypothetical protein
MKNWKGSRMASELQEAARRELIRRRAGQELARRRSQTAQSPEMQAGLAEMSAMTQNPSRAQYDALPEWQKPLAAASDTAQLMASGAMMGFGEKGAAMLRAPFSGRSYEDELAEQRRLTTGAQRRAGGAGTAAQIAGAVMTPVAAAGKGLTLAGRGGTAAMTGAKGLGARSALMGVEGAGYGALTAAGNDQDIGTGATIGGAAGVLGNAAGEAISGGVGKVAGMFNRKPAVPTSGEWKSKADVAFARMRKEGVIFTPNALDDLQTKLNTYLTKRGYWPDNQPGIKGGLAMIDDYKARGGNMTPDGLMALRERFSGGYVMGNKNNNSMVREAINLIDDLLRNPKKGFVSASGNPSSAARAYRDGMTASRNQHKLQDVEYLVGKGQRQGDRNITDNANKRVKALLSDKLLDERSPMSRGWNAAEKEAIKKASSWTTGERLAHAGSGAAPQGKLTGAAQAGGLLFTVPAALAGNPIPLLVQGATVGGGMASKAAADSLARKSVLELTRLIANGGVPPAQVQNLLQRLSHSKREALSRALMAISVQRGIPRNEAPAQQGQP